jgi:hypothetical protein
MQSGSLGRRGLDFAEPVLSEVEGLHPGYSLSRDGKEDAFSLAPG